MILATRKRKITALANQSKKGKWKLLISWFTLDPSLPKCSPFGFGSKNHSCQGKKELKILLDLYLLKLIKEFATDAWLGNYWWDYKISIWQIQISIQQVQSSIRQIQIFIDKFKSSLNKFKAPSNKFKSPSNKFKSPSDKFKASSFKLKSRPDIQQIQSSIDKFKAPFEFTAYGLNDKDSVVALKMGFSLCFVFSFPHFPLFPLLQMFLGSSPRFAFGALAGFVRHIPKGKGTIIVPRGPSFISKPFLGISSGYNICELFFS